MPVACRGTQAVKTKAEKVGANHNIQFPATEAGDQLFSGEKHPALQETLASTRNSRSCSSAWRHDDKRQETMLENGQDEREEARKHMAVQHALFRTCVTKIGLCITSGPS